MYKNLRFNKTEISYMIFEHCIRQLIKEIQYNNNIFLKHLKKRVVYLK